MKKSMTVAMGAALMLAFLATPASAQDARIHLVVLRGEVVPGELGEGVDGCCPVERAVGSVVIVEVDEAVVGGSALVL